MSYNRVTYRDFEESNSIIETIALYFKRDYFYTTDFKHAAKWPFLATLGAYLAFPAIIIAVVTQGGSVGGPILTPLASLGTACLVLAWFFMLFAHPVVWLVSKVWRYKNGYMLETGSD